MVVYDNKATQGGAALSEGGWELRLYFARMAATLLLATSAAAAAYAEDYVMPPQQMHDEKIVAEIFHGTASRGFASIQDNAPALSVVLEHAPAKFPAYEKVGSIAVVRPDDEDGTPILIAMVKVLFKGQIKEIQVQYDTYPLAAFLLASNANENGRWDDAVRFADRGLALQSDNALLTSEKAMALYQMGKIPEGLSLVRSWLTANQISTAGDRARLLRAEGWGLVEVRDLDAAQAAYEESLKYEPNHANALHELECIKGLRDGSATCRPNLMTSNEAKDGKTVSADDQK